ncbi:pilus assembly PilX family protein [Pelobacter seleniigenes]|uniref:pilus assembly PilX family protein n=1 Tax=Pelobacter seleniigenes TaxID=407188 RepID=UPI0004A6AB73|nr:PilX N-terminal domain-containing pilus assembly protein [Pelobacter seleniigenes]
MSLLKTENGSILITGILILVILSILGLTAMRSTLLQAKMANNLEQQDIAFQAAETGLRRAEAQMSAYSTLPTFSGSSGLYQPASAGGTPRWESVDWSASSACIVYQSINLSTTPPTPEIKCIAEYLTSIADDSNPTVDYSEVTTYYDMIRLTCRGVSPNGRAKAMLQTTYLR